MNGVFYLITTNREMGLWITFGTNHIVTLLTNGVDPQKLEAPFRDWALFRYPSWKFPGELRNASVQESHRTQAYEPLPDNVLMMQKLAESHNHKVAVSIHAIDPDESAYAFSEQLRRIFRSGGYPTIMSAPPSNLPQVPGVSCFLFAGASADNGGLLEALALLLSASGSAHRQGSVIMAGDPAVTNAEAVIIIRHK